MDAFRGRPERVWEGPAAAMAASEHWPELRCRLKGARWVCNGHAVILDEFRLVERGMKETERRRDEFGGGRCEFETFGRREMSRSKGSLENSRLNSNHRKRRLASH